MKKWILKINRYFYYGWVIVFISALAAFFSSPGQTYSVSVFINLYETEFGISKTLLSSGYSIATIISGCLLLFMGRAIDRFGQRTMLLIVSILLTITIFYNSIVTNLLMIYVGFFLLRFFGQGSLTLIPNTMIPQWFEKRRAFAISLSTIGYLVATLFVPTINLWLIRTYHWQNAWRIWGLFILFLFIPLVYLFVRNKPEDLNIPMENEASSTEDTVLISLEKMEKESWTLKEALHSKIFWFVGMISVIVPMFSTGVTFHFFSILEMRNISNDAAAWIIGLIALPMAIMPFISRLVIDKAQFKHIFFVTHLMILLSMLFILFFVSSVGTAIFFILFYGLAVSVQSVTLNTLWPTYFGRKYLGSVRGAAIVFMVIGSALGPLPFGLSYDLTANYNAAIIIMVMMTIGTLFLSLLITKPIK